MCAPVGSTTVSRPPKVRRAGLSGRSRKAAPTRTGAYPKEFERATRTAVPPMVERATMRTVCAVTVVGAASWAPGSWSGGASSGISGPPPSSAAGANCCAVPQVAIQWFSIVFTSTVDGGSEPTGDGLFERVTVRFAVAGPGDDPVRPDEHGAEIEVVTCRAGRVADPLAVAQRHVAQTRVGGEVQGDASAVLEQLAEAGSVGEAEIRCVVAHQRLVAAEVVAGRRARGALEDVRGAVAGRQQIAHHGLDRPGQRVRPHDRHLCARPVEHPRADRVAFGGVGVEQAVRRLPAYRRRELPAQV